MDETDHIIGVQEFQITSDDEGNAHHYQSAVSALQESKIRTLLEKVLNQYSSPDNIYRFKQIELNLGAIHPHDFDTELLLRLEEQLIQFFKSNIRPDGNLRMGEKIVLSNQKLEQLEHFLINGFFQWNSTSSITPQKIFHELIPEAPDKLTELLKKQGKKQVVRKRMILQFPEKSLEKIVTHVAKTEGEYIITYKRNMLDHHGKTKFIDTGYSTFRNAVWEVILAYLFESTNSYYNKKTFLQFLIRKIALKYNLTYQTLLEVISKGVDFENETSRIPEFRKLVAELSHEEQTKSSFIQNDYTAHKSILDLIQELTLFLTNETSTYTSPFYSQKEFELALKNLMQNPNAITQKHITKWLSNPKIRKRLFKTLSPYSISVLLEIGAKNRSIAISSFLEAIEKEKHVLHSECKSLLQKIIKHKAQLLFLSISESDDTEFILHFLNTIKKELDFIDNAIFSLFIEMEKKLFPPYQKIIQKFLQQHPKQIALQQKRNKRDLHIIEFSEELYQFMSTNGVHLWVDWLASHTSTWSKKSKFPTLLLLQGIQLKLEERFTAPEIVMFISDEIKNLESASETAHSFQPVKNTFIHPSIINLITKELIGIKPLLFSEWSPQVLALFQKISIQYKISFPTLFNTFLSRAKNQSGRQSYLALLQLKSSEGYRIAVKSIKKQETKTIFSNNISYIFQTGKWPWWATNYGKEQFNQEFKKLWAIPSEQKILIKALKKNSVIKNYTSFFDIENMHILWEKLDSSTTKNFSTAFIHIHSLLHQNLLPISSISTTNLKKFEQEVFVFFTTAPSSKKNIVTLLQSWLDNTFIIQNTSTRNLWIQSLNIIAKKSNAGVKKHIQSWIKDLNNVTSDSSPKSENSVVRLFLTNYFTEINIEKNTQPALKQLEQISLQQPHIFNQWIQQSEFRTHLIQQLKNSDIVHLAHLKLNDIQQQFLNDSLYVMDNIQRLLSPSASKQIRLQFYNQVFLQIGSNNINHWTVEKWATMIYNLLIPFKPSQKISEFLHQTDFIDAKKTNLLLIQNIRKIQKSDAPPLATNPPFSADAFLEQLKNTKPMDAGQEVVLLLTQLFKTHLDLLKEVQFREQIIKLTDRQILDVAIKDSLSVTQKEHFSAVLAFIHKIPVTTAEFKKIDTHFYHLLLLKLSSSGFTSWSLDHWGKLLQYVLEKVLGKVKSQTLLLTEKEKLMSTTAHISNTNFKLINHMQNKFQSTPEPSQENSHSEEQDYRKLGEKESRQYLNPIFVDYSGLILLAPYLGILFEKCGLVKNSAFIDSQSQCRAVHLLDYAATGSVGKEEHQLVLHKVLCGMNISDPIELLSDLTTQEKEIIESLLYSVTQQWNALKNTSIDSLRSSFLIRTGKLEEDEDAFHLKVEQKAFDMLLDQVPWNITQIKLSWMDKILLVEWR